MYPAPAKPREALRPRPAAASLRQAEINGGGFIHALVETT